MGNLFKDARNINIFPYVLCAPFTGEILPLECAITLCIYKKNIPLKIIFSSFLSYYPRVFNLKEDIF